MFSAARIASEARDMAIANRSETRAHVEECGRRWENLQRTMREQEDARRADAELWRQGLGKRLDTQDKNMDRLYSLGIKVGAFIIVTMLSMMGYGTAIILSDHGINASKEYHSQ